MNPLTQVKNTQKITAREAAAGISEQGSWHEKYKESAYINVGLLPFELTEGDLLAVFAQYGEVVDVNLVRDKATGKSRGFAFLAYEDQRSTVLAVDNLNGARIVGRTIRVDHVANYKKKKEEDEEEEQRKREERGVCYAFQRGECNRGAACKFSHDEQRNANTGWGRKEDGPDGHTWGRQKDGRPPPPPPWKRNKDSRNDPPPWRRDVGQKDNSLPSQNDNANDDGPQTGHGKRQREHSEPWRVDGPPSSRHNSTQIDDPPFRRRDDTSKDAEVPRRRGIRADSLWRRDTNFKDGSSRRGDEGRQEDDTAAQTDSPRQERPPRSRNNQRDDRDDSTPSRRPDKRPKGDRELRRAGNNQRDDDSPPGASPNGYRPSARHSNSHRDDSSSPRRPSTSPNEDRRPRRRSDDGSPPRRQDASPNGHRPLARHSNSHRDDRSPPRRGNTSHKEDKQPRRRSNN